MKILKQAPADVIMAVAPTGGKLAGGVVVILSGNAGMIGVATEDIASLTAGPVVIKNAIVTLAAVNNAAFVQGDKLYWDASAGKLTKVTTGNTFAGRAAAAKATSTALADLLIGQA